MTTTGAIKEDRRDILYAFRQIEAQLAYQGESSVSELRHKLSKIKEIASNHLKNN